MIEFIAGFSFFWIMCLYLAEISYVSYVSGLGDAMITNAVRASKLTKDGGGFLDAFDDAARDSNSIWSNYVVKDGFRTSIRYVDTYSNLSSIIDPCEPEDGNSTAECGNSDDAPIAIYRITYNYKPIFSTIFGDNVSIFAREMIVIQEYERSKFDLNG